MTILKYPKKLFSKKEVERERKGMDTPHWWIHGSTKTHHTLLLKGPKKKELHRIW